MMSAHNIIIINEVAAANNNGNSIIKQEVREELITLRDESF